MSLIAYFAYFKKTYEELNMLLSFNPHIKVQQAHREQVVVMSFQASLPSKFDTTKSQILSSSEISSLHDIINRILVQRVLHLFK